MTAQPKQLLSSSLDPFVQSLMQATTTLKPGQIIMYAAVETHTGLSLLHKSFRAVVSRWRRDMLTHRNVYVVCVPTLGYRLCEADQHLTESAKIKRQATKRTRKALAVLMHTTDIEVSEPLRRVLEHERIKTALTLQAQTDDLTSHRRLLGAPEQLPKILAEHA